MIEEFPLAWQKVQDTAKELTKTRVHISKLLSSHSFLSS